MMSGKRTEALVTPYTQGVWQVKPGYADDFVNAWTEFAEWTKTHVNGAQWAKLLRDTDDENRFVSIGPWESTGAIEHWRSLEGWGERVGKIRELLVGFQPATLEPVVELDE
jgi:heme-degrading monooxygenase HmoA